MRGSGARCNAPRSLFAQVAWRMCPAANNGVSTRHFRTLNGRRFGWILFCSGELVRFDKFRPATRLGTFPRLGENWLKRAAPCKTAKYTAIRELVPVEFEISGGLVPVSAVMIKTQEEARESFNSRRSFRFSFVSLLLQAMLAGAAFLQGFLDFCAGCFIFEYLLKWGLISKSVYRMHVNTRCLSGTWYYL